MKFFRWANPPEEKRYLAFGLHIQIVLEPDPAQEPPDEGDLHAPENRSLQSLSPVQMHKFPSHPLKLEVPTTRLTLRMPREPVVMLFTRLFGTRFRLWMSELLDFTAILARVLVAKGPLDFFGWTAIAPLLAGALFCLNRFRAAVSKVQSLPPASQIQQPSS